MNELQLPICAAIFLALLCIVYFSKERLNLIENRLYSVMLVTGLIDSIIIIIERLLVLNGDITTVSSGTKFILQCTNKLDFLVLIIYTTCAFLYTLLITYPNMKEKIKKLINVTLVLDIIVYSIILMSNVDLITNGSIISVSGQAIVITYVFGGLYLIISMIMALLNIGKLTKRHIPIISAIFILIILVLIFRSNPYIMIISITIAFVNYLMFFTIENPDIKMIEELTKAKALVEKNNNDKSIFIFNTAQQIRYPLNMIDQRADQILDEDNLDEIKNMAVDIKNAKQRISYVLNGAMDVSTIDAKKIKIVDSKYSLSNLLTEICLKFKSMSTEKNLEFRKNIEESLPETLYGDSIRLKQIISALLLNAIKYTKEGFVELNVNTVITYDVCRLVISVKDSGIGVNAEKLNKIFSQNDDTKIEDVDSKEMTLDTAKKVVNLIGGTITVRSEKNKGSEFTLIVDQKIASSNDKIDNIINEYKKTEDKIKILLVD
ncbi:MAG: HAMP domain-containing sensor histidine kinase, partial [Bacilli bacterium]|nr:HAMP domain-containing sensor histidine kinase [Bacilli bacterium]